MPTPKRRHSKKRRNKNRSHYALTAPHYIDCPECGEPTLPHRVCPSCGLYKGKQVIETEEE